MVDGVFKRLANIFSPSDSKSEGSQEPLYLTPDGKRLRNMGPVTAKLRPEAIKNWSHPFKEKSNPLEQLTQLANAASGSYPLGVGGLWHGGVHFDSGTLSSLDKASVHCIADGEVVAYCIDRNSAKTVYVVNKLHLMKPYSRNFVLVRHRLEPPAIEGETESPPRSLFFYSLYMHLQDGATYESDLTIDRPSFWPESKICFVPETAKDVSAGTPKQYGLNVRHRAHQGKVLDLLPKGAQVTVSGEGDFRKLESSTGPSYLQNEDGSLLGYVDFDRLESIGEGEYRLKGDLNVHVDPTVQSKTIGQKLPTGTQVKVNGEGKFRKLEHITQYVYIKSLQSLRVPQYDGVHVLSEPLPIKAGEMIGHIGWYQDYAADRPEQKLHLEVFSEDDVGKFIEDCRKWALSLPTTSKPWLKLAKGTAVVAHQDHFNAKQLPTFSTADAVSGTDLLVPKSLLDSLPAAEKITVPAMAGRKAYNWYRLNQLLNDTDNKLLNGWVREEVGVTPWVSPWEWQDYAVITDYTSAPAFMAAFLRSLKRFTDQQLQRYGALADAGDSGPIKERLCHIIDRDGNKKMTAEEIQAAIRIPAHAQSISRLIICCESEWYYKPQKWDGLDEIFGHGGSTPHINWLAEKERIKQLSWWGEVADKVGLPVDGKVYHFHPVGLAGWFSNVKKHPEIFINGIKTELRFLELYDGSVIEESDFVLAAATLGCEVEAIKAVAITETGSLGSYFTKAEDDKVATILFERHYFHQLTGGRFDHSDPDISSPVSGGYGLHSAQYGKMVRAYRLSASEALKSASWGRFQIMGRYFSNAGYSSVEEFVRDLNCSEKNHLKAFVSFIKFDAVLSSAIVRKDWLRFALKYNGPAQKGYDRKMRDNYNALKGL
ncbi:N-acetylmuramidase family protein [Pseudomonas sp. WS 5059]|uniref:N-acetylmuramidase family protein n=1 Tax=Pseudomonas sp. WS 5059 TaxID=2717491 RepID=UPI001472CA9F|nr:N-acetylmuramidase family protein [Pseudomonas sp. WS 5059]NMY01559.1 N-acetylmuramidase family protein [Pseudomonas sp. WS 5059]